MNRQNAPHGIEWTRVAGRPGYTANPIKGCQHECRWRMPDGKIAECYAEAISRKFSNHQFSDIRYALEELQAIDRLKEPSGIFIDSMSDLFGRGVAADKIEAVLNCCTRNPQHIFQSLTKNAPRLLNFHKNFPPNLWPGVSAPPTFMFGKELTDQQRESFVMKALDSLAEVGQWVPIVWMSIEPLSFNIVEVFKRWVSARKADFPLKWAVIGAASNGAKLHQPDPHHVGQLLEFLDYWEVPVFFKGNLDWKPWRQEFPRENVLKQEALL